MSPSQPEHPDHPTIASAVKDALPVSPALGAMMAARTPRKSMQVDRRVVLVSVIAILLAGVCALVAQLLTALIGIVTNLVFYGRWSTALTSPADNHLGLWVIVVPVLGSLVVGLM